MYNNISKWMLREQKKNKKEFLAPAPHEEEKQH